MRLAAAALLLVALALPAAPAAARPIDAVSAPAAQPADFGAVQWRRSTPVGLPFRGRLRDGVRLPEQGVHFFTWNGAFGHFSNPPWRRWGSHALVATLLEVAAAHRAANPGAPRMAIGDLSRRHGGPFGARFGGLGHASHQNGLDADVYYPRRDGREEQADRPRQVDRRLAQDLVDRFVAAGATQVFVGPRLRLRGPRGVVSALAHHDDHLHVRLPAR